MRLHEVDLRHLEQLHLITLCRGCHMSIENSDSVEKAVAACISRAIKQAMLDIAERLDGLDQESDDEE